MGEARNSFDRNAWNALLQVDADIEAAATYLGGFGAKYVDDLADSYLAIGEKRYLAAIVAKLRRQAEQEALTVNPSSQVPTAIGRVSPRWDGRLEIRVQHSAHGIIQPKRVGDVPHSPNPQRANVLDSASPSSKLGLPVRLVLGATSVILILIATAATLTLHEYSLLRSAHGDADRLEAYERQCHICAFKSQASTEAERLRLITQDRENFQRARGDIPRLSSYLSSCVICAFKGVAVADLVKMRATAALDSGQAKDAELRTEVPQTYRPAQSVTWKMTNSTGFQIGVQFFSRLRPDYKWPPNSKWSMEFGETGNYNVGCSAGEKICYGASAESRTETWGVGNSGTIPCNNCCISCDDQIHAFTLRIEGARNRQIDAGAE